MANYASLLSSTANTVLTVTTKWNEDRVNIPNNAYIIELCPALEPVAAACGVDLKEAGYTFTMSKGKDGYRAYQPYVASRNGVVSLVWGNVSKPVSEIADMDIAEEKEKPVFVIEVDGKDYKFPVMFPKDVKVDFSTAKKALKAGKLGDMLSKGFEKGKKLNELAPGDYTVTAVRDNVFKGEVNYDIFVEGEGWFKANSKIKRRLTDELVINEANPAALTIHGVFEKTSTGYDIVSLDFLSKQELDLPAFVF